MQPRIDLLSPALVTRVLDEAFQLMSEPGVKVLSNRAQILLKDAGAGIVYDSVPETEYNETEFKARSCLRAIRNGESA